jgi:O-antigen biosynthesis protein
VDGGRCSVVISCRDRPASLATCIGSVQCQGLVGLEIIVADSASRSLAVREVAEQRGTRYLRIDQPGLSRARNRGASVAKGEFVVFLDDDVTLDPGCLAALLDEFADGRVAAVGGRILAVGGDAAARDSFESFGGFDPGPGRRVVDRAAPDWFELVNFGGLGSGAMFALRRSVLSAWGGFDERLGRGAPLDAGEEMHAYFSLVRAGHRVVYTPDAVARHPAPASFLELRQRILHGAVTASAYLALLFAEYPEQRPQVVRYVAEALRGQERQWRPKPASARTAVVPRWRERLAWLLGPWSYLRMRIRTRTPRRIIAGGVRDRAGRDS